MKKQNSFKDIDNAKATQGSGQPASTADQPSDQEKVHTPSSADKAEAPTQDEVQADTAGLPDNQPASADTA